MLRDIPVKALIIIGFLITGLIPVMIVALIGFNTSKVELKKQAFNQLESIRNIKKAGIERFFARCIADTQILAQDPFVRQAFTALNTALKESGGVAGGKLKGFAREQYDAPAAYKKIHDQYFPFFKEYIRLYGYYDLLLLDPLAGDTSFSVKKETDFAARVSKVSSSLHDVWQGAMQTRRVTLSDTRPYVPSENIPAQFVAAPLMADGKPAGVIAVQISLETIDAIMSERSGMGSTGETYLVGQDKKMRSDSYLDKKNHSVAASFRGNTAAHGVDTEASREALAGTTSSGIITDYRGKRVLSAYAPVDMYGIRWALIAEIDEQEIDDQIGAALNSKIILLLVLSVALVVLLALLLSSIISRSISTVVSQVGALSGEVINGRLNARGDPDRVGIDFQAVVTQINALVSSFAAHLDSLPVPVMIVDRNYTIQFINRAAASIAGINQRDLIGQRCGDALRADVCGTEACAVKRAMQSGSIESGEGTACPTGQKMNIFFTAAPVIDAHGNIAGGLEVAIDQTAIRKVMEENQQMEEHLRRMQRLEAIGTLAGGIAHDFNNILTYMYAYADIVMDELPQESAARKDVDEIVSAINRARDLVQQILLFSRQMNKDTAPLNIVPLIRETLKLLKATLPRSIKITEDIPADEAYVMADVTQIQQVLMNLCTNAFHAMQEQGGTLTVSLKEVQIDARNKILIVPQAGGRYCRLTVSDTGHGMDQRTQERIFEPFFTTKPVGKGTGLGLSVVHGIVHNYGGAVTVCSEPGSGTTFDVYLPLIDRDAYQGKVHEAAKLPQAGKGSILFVDDEDHICRAGKQMLESLGYQVTIETSSTRALALFTSRADAFNLVITDLSMPDMGGLLLVEKIFALRPRMPVILTTGYSEAMTLEKAQQAGISDLLMKPYNKTDLSTSIRHVLYKKERVFLKENSQ